MIRSRKSSGQVAIEFIILLFLGVFFVFTFIVIVKSMSNDKLSSKALDELDDLGKSVQQELLLATKLEDGYQRELYIPYQLYGREYELNLTTVSSQVMYLDFYYEDYNLFYAVPHMSGDLTKGHNTISKQNGTIYITQ